MKNEFFNKKRKRNKAKSKKYKVKNKIGREDN